MSLDTQEWTKEEALHCWSAFNEKYIIKHGGALHYAIINGDVTPYIEREAKVFERYAKMWHYNFTKEQK